MGLFVIKKRVEVRQTPVAGLAGWMLELVCGWRSSAARPVRRQLRVVETLAIGGRKQIVLVSCGGERFLVGSGPDSVQSIVRVRPEQPVRESTENLAQWPEERR